MRAVAADPPQLLQDVVALERRDASIAHELEIVRTLAEKAGAARLRAAEVREAIERLPQALEELGQRRDDTQAAEAEALAELEQAKSRVASLESGRRRRTDELERARSEAATAGQALGDIRSELERLDATEARLRADEASLATEAERLVGEAAEIAAGLEKLERLAEGARRSPGATLDDLEEWGAQVRSALFVVRGTLEIERERIVVEANAIGSAVLGEALGASSVATVRRRVEQALT
jgi:chromosome segregation ATPase